MVVVLLRCLDKRLTQLYYQTAMATIDLKLGQLGQHVVVAAAAADVVVDDGAGAGGDDVVVVHATHCDDDIVAGVVVLYLEHVDDMTHSQNLPCPSPPENIPYPST